MKIVDMRVTPVAMADPPLRSSYGLHQPYALRTIVQLFGEDGLYGAAETHGGEQALADFARVRSHVVGTDAYALASIASDIDQEFVDVPSPGGPADRSQMYVVPGEGRPDVPLRVYGAIEVAALDLIGKAVGRPVCDLLGGRVRDEVPFSAYLFYKHRGGGGSDDDARADEWGEALSPEQIVDQAQRMVARYGFGSVKLKGGVLAPDVEQETIRALRGALGPAIPLRIDPNNAWSVATSLAMARGLAGVLEYLEDPAPGLGALSEVRRELVREGIDMPIASNTTVTGFGDIPEAVRLDAVQVILADHHYWGGPRAVTQLGRLCETFGLGLSMHSNSHLGLSLMAMVHVAAATPQLRYSCDTHYPWQAASDEIVEGGRIAITGGSVKVPRRPGLGVELDEDALARGRERYEKCGYVRRDDEAEMRRVVDSSWRRAVPAW